MSAPVRKLALTAHVAASVGWAGAVAAFLALAMAGLSGSDAISVRAAYVAMNILGWYVIVPLSFASFITGVVQSLGTSWGLFRHYWVIVKLVINILCTLLLLVHMRPVSYMAAAAAKNALGERELRAVRLQLVVDPLAALAALLVATALSVYKPRGVTPYGWRKQKEERSPSAFAP